MTDEVKSGAPKDKVAGQMNEIDQRLKRIDRWLDGIAFTLSPGNSPSLAGMVASIANRLEKIEERLQRIEVAAGIFADIDKLQQIADRLQKIEEKLKGSN